MWTKERYGKTYDHDNDKWIEMGGHWTISNGHIQFDVHVLYDGSGQREKYPDGEIVSNAEADAYADRILEKLNERDTIDFRPRIR